MVYILLHRLRACYDPFGVGEDDWAMTGQIHSRGGSIPPHTLRLWTGLLVAISLFIGIPWFTWGQQRSLADVFIGQTPERDIGLGLLTGTLCAFLAWWLLQRIPSLARVLYTIREAINLPALDTGTLIIMAMGAGVGEEIIFRGILQPYLGVWGTAVLFGLAHPLSPSYTVYAALAGLVLGYLALWTHALLAPMVCHAMYDGLLLMWLKRSSMEENGEPASSSL